MKKWETISLFLLAAVYVVQLSIKFKFSNGHVWISSHLADVICLPLMLLLAQSIIRKLKGNQELRLGVKHILFTWIYVSMVFEWLLPKFSSKYTADFLDVFYYLMGGLLFYAMQHIFKAQEKTIPNKR